MARRCQITGKRKSMGNNRSHSNRATRREYRVNLVTKKILNPATGQIKKMRIATSTLRTLAKTGR